MSEHDELNREIARLLGLNPDVIRADGRPLGPGDYGRFATSLDALQEPERLLKQAGLRLFIATNFDGEIMAEWVDRRGVQRARGDHEVEAEARALAVRDGLRALKGEQ